jgi:cellobiose phosphorylase
MGIRSELWAYVALDAPVKLVVVKVRNRSGRPRRLSVTGYWELALGQWRHANLMHVVTEIDPNTGALCARNVYNREFAGKTVFVHVADLYAVAPHTGRGGWTWCTGSAGWMYRLIVETLLGVRLEVDKLRLNPRLPRAWESLKLHYRHHDTFYHITVKRAAAEAAAPAGLIVDGQAQPDATIQLVDDRQEHTVEMNVG